MPTRKSSSTSRARKPAVTSSMGTSYDTKMLIVVLLLLFVYPIGLIFMWLWMKTWPTWLKIIISLPFIIAVIFFVMIMYFIGSAIRNGNMQQYRYQRNIYRMRPTYNGNMMFVSPSLPPNTY